MGLLGFTPQDGIEFGACDNKDVCIFPGSIADDAGRPSITELHRPHFAGGHGESPAGIWISYAPVPREDAPDALGPFAGHQLLAKPGQQWEHLKIGCGTPQVLTRLGWLIVYHGVGGRDEDGCRTYSAGVMVLDADDPRRILYRSADPVLSPVRPEEQSGVCSDVVFPTGIDARPDLGDFVFDIYYGMADSRIGVARLTLVT